MSLLYIDTNLFINVINNEVSMHSNKNMAEPASRLFFDALSCKHRLLISTWTINELYRIKSYEQFTMTLELCKKKIVIIEHDAFDKESAMKKSPDNWQDALHIILAQKGKADFIVTRNISDFVEIGSSIPIKKPEQLL